MRELGILALSLSNHLLKLSDDLEYAKLQTDLKQQKLRTQRWLMIEGIISMPLLGLLWILREPSSWLWILAVCSSTYVVLQPLFPWTYTHQVKIQAIQHQMLSLADEYSQTIHFSGYGVVNYVDNDLIDVGALELNFDVDAINPLSDVLHALKHDPDSELSISKLHGTQLTKISNPKHFEVGDYVKFDYVNETMELSKVNEKEGKLWN